jgi:hypothetical protein
MISEFVVGSSATPVNRSGRRKTVVASASLKMPAASRQSRGSAWTGGLVQRISGGPFPSGTLIVNLSGCLAIGFLGMILTGPEIGRAHV